MLTKVFNRDYAATRLQGAVDMLRDAKTIEEVEAAIGHLDTVFNETQTAAREARLYWR